MDCIAELTGDLWDCECPECREIQAEVSESDCGHPRCTLRYQALIAHAGWANVEDECIRRESA